MEITAEDFKSLGKEIKSQRHSQAVSLYGKAIEKKAQIMKSVMNGLMNVPLQVFLGEVDVALTYKPPINPGPDPSLYIH